MEIAPKISVNEKICFGKPVISETRIPVELIIAKLAEGMTYEELVTEYKITGDDILAALDYAAKTLSSEEIKVVGSNANNGDEPISTRKIQVSL